MAPTGPLEIQEIVDLVVSYLKRNDIKTCVHVSKSWRRMFLPYRWRIVTAGSNVETYGGTSPIGPKQDAISNHRHLIRDLSLFNKVRGYDEYHYPNLRRLVIDMSRHASKSNPLLMNITTMAPMLADLTLVGVTAPSTFWETLSTHPSIRHLDLAYLSLDVDDASGLWRTCIKLESLQMANVGIDDRCRPENVVFAQLRQLRLHSPDFLEGSSYHMNLMLQSPMLESRNRRPQGRQWTRSCR
jgi:hypothetical protein